MALKLYRNILFGVSIVILLAVLYVSNPAQIYSALLTSKTEFVIMAVIATSFTAMLRVFKWSMLLRTGFFGLIPVQLLGITVSVLTPGRVAEPTKALLLKLKNGTPVSASLPSIIWERVLDITAILIFATFALSSLANTGFSVFGYVGVAVFAALVIVLLLILCSQRTGLFVFNKIVRRIPFLKNLRQGFINNFYSVRISRGRITFGFVLAVVIWLVDGLALYFILLSFDAAISPAAAVGIVALSVMIGVASSLPGGFGSTEVVLILLLNANGIQNPVAVTSVFLYRFVTIWYGLLLGFVSFVYLSRKINLREIKLMK